MANHPRAKNEATSVAKPAVNWAFGAEQGIEGEDFELDAIVRKHVHDWRATTAEEGFPFWTV